MDKQGAGIAHGQARSTEWTRRSYGLRSGWPLPSLLNSQSRLSWCAVKVNQLKFPEDTDQARYEPDVRNIETGGNARAQKTEKVNQQKRAKYADSVPEYRRQG